MVVPLFSAEDGELLICAALLHDVGYAPELAATRFHSLDGALYLRSVGAPDRLVNLVAHHSCAVLEAELRGLSGELAEFEDERTALRDALWWADMTTTPDGAQTTAAERVAEIQRRTDRMIWCRGSSGMPGTNSVQRWNGRSVGWRRLGSIRRRRARDGVRSRAGCGAGWRGGC